MPIRRQKNSEQSVRSLGIETSDVGGRSPYVEASFLKWSLYCCDSGSALRQA